MLEMIIDSIRINPSNYQRVVILKEKDGERYLPIWIGPAEADAIAVKLQNLEAPRPLTHDLLQEVIRVLDGSVEYVLIRKLTDNTFCASIFIQIKDAETMDIDCRSSDAMALAVRIPSPIYVEEAVLEKAGILLDEETGTPIAGEGQDTNEPSSEAKPVTPQELERMSAFEETVEGLDLEDFGKGKEDDPKSPR